jgi:outer membrane receptor protein involved in Fe transport
VSGLNGAGNLLSVGGQSQFNGGWNQQFDMTFTTNAPYADLNFDIGKLNLDGSVREEFFQGSGWAQGSSGNPIGNASVRQSDPRDPTGKTQVTTLVPILGYDNPAEAANFQEHATNWSLGALYKFTPDMSVFARASRGTRFNADRLTRSTPSYFSPDGTLSAAGQANAAFPVTQQELGLKNRGELFSGHYTLELTGFYSKYSISSQEINRANCINVLGIDAPTCIIAGQYKDWGLELFSTYKAHGFNMLFSATYDHSEVAASQKSPYKRSPNIPSLTYTGLFSYDVMSRGEIGISLDGQSSVPGGDGNSYPGSTIVGAFLKYRPANNLQLGLDVYNLFNTYAAPGAAGFIGGTNNTLVNAGVAQGTGIKATVRLSF